MTAVSFVVKRGTATFHNNSAVTVGTTAPGSLDIQFCWNQTDALGNNITRKDLVMALELFRQLVLRGGGVVETTGVIGPP